MSSHQRQDSIASLSSTATGNIHPQKIGPWKLGKTLGRGATGRVLLATHQSTGQKAAVKVVSKSELNDDEINKKSADEAGLPYGIEREIIIMKLLTHPNVLRLYDVWETSKALYLVLEYVEGGELFDLLVERGPLQEVEAIKYFRQIILGTAYCHALGICHRDLKPENLLLDSGLNVKLADFGMAALESNGKLLETSCGSPHYAAPEIVSGLKYHGAASDIWSCGVILFALLTGRLPFDDENIRNLLLKVQAGSFEMPCELSPEAVDLIDKMLTVDPMKRIPTERILSHPLLTKYPIPNEDLISVKSLPHPETAYKSLGSEKNIDKQILQNLSILWHDRSQGDIVDCLLKTGSNPEKTFYALLMRYRHNQEESAGSSPTRSNSQNFNNKIGNKDNNRKKRMSQVSASTSRNRPVSFQYKNGIKSSIGNGNGRLSSTSSVSNSPRKSPVRRSSNRYSFAQSPRKFGGTSDETTLHSSSVPRNIYNEIVSAQRNGQGVMPPPLPSKDNMDSKSNPIVDEVSNQDLLSSAKISPTKNKRGSVIRNSISKNRLSRRKSRTSFTPGLKRNSITTKLLSTYAKLAGETDWEFMDKQTKRTSATFATLCDKIFNQEQYDAEDEKLIDEEEKQAKEYERLMEIERKKHEAELRARKELAKQRKREKRKSLLSSRKLSILVKDDANNSEQDITVTDSDALSQPKRQSRNQAMRSISEGHGKESDDLTKEDLENLKRRSVTQPTPRRRKTPVLTRRPVSRLDPLWTAYENEEIERAQDALEAEYRDADFKTKKKINRESMVSVMDDKEVDNEPHVDDDATDEVQDEEAVKAKSRGYELPEPDMERSDLSDEYMSEIRKSRLLNSQLNINAIANGEKEVKSEKRQDKEPKTLIGDVRIPTVTRKSRCFTNSNKRLSVLSMYSTKQSYRDLNSILGDENDENNDVEGQLPQLRTSFADRLDRAGLADAEEEDDEPLDEGSIMDFDQHLANKRSSYYAGDKSRRQSRYSTTKRNSQAPTVDVPAIPKKSNKERDREDDTFVTKDDDVHRRKSAYSAKGANNNDDEDMIFENIKLPNEDRRQSASTAKSNKKKSFQPSAESMLIPNVDNIPEDAKTRKPDPRSQPYEKVRKPKVSNGELKSTGPEGQVKNPLEDTTNEPRENQKRKGSIFRKLSWGSKKTMDNSAAQLPSPADSRAPSVEEKPKSKSGFFRWFSSSSNQPGIESEIRRFKAILPKQEMSSALFALLNSWSNFGLKNLRNDTVGYNITGEISKNNAFNLKNCKFRIKVNPREFNQKSEIVCARVKGSKVTTDTLFKEIEKVLQKEGVMDI
ncbi:DEHA2E14080p [Debaryomyces hansenii CBS767]|uniref:non-specific serine/threonine protein kinase n=1 Tax=Debaryomyces hansenii (strain ATCC 36239 / CBS 767 / BCRC 21394 / JCM 1990 / NBRC 0083 / IGC 2968) TaxID=284592 RepID=Q6BPF2_DEBHA|nr:DEHA2E14080p [Debaryomyces hansenii CBS767]CAG88160.2 DEHA2E14080p [Debaryomyces hansenii CBS767]|eukprot:XP_459918.2 DEHA2E14080p [Debaryomyces hansenii CBS767]